MTPLPLEVDYRNSPSPAAVPSTYDIASWEVDFLATLRSKFSGIADKDITVRYPIRMLRYWFSYHLLVAEQRRLGRSLDILELGTHNGQMRVFAKLAASRVQDRAQRLRWSRWRGVDAEPKRDYLASAGYHDVQKANIEAPHFDLLDCFDTAVCLHIFEHTADPGAVLCKAAAALRPGGSIIGGSPVLPHFLVRFREGQLRKTAQRFGHVTVFSPTRVRELVEAAGLQLEFISGAYFMRHKGFICENSRAWLRLNLKWGRAFPWWPGEIHWLARKVEAR